MRATVPHDLRAPTRMPVVLLLIAALASGACGNAVPSSSPAATAAPTKTASAEPIVSPAASAEPTPSPAASSEPQPSQPQATATPADALAPGALAVTVSDNLRVRSLPEVSDASVKYQPLLPTGTQLVISGGPVRASGYTWYRVIPIGVTLKGGVDEGWVAIADHDGTPWIALADDPTPGFELASVQVVRPPSTRAEARAAAASVNAFGVDLYRRMLRDPGLALAGKGVVFSPASVAFALAMARAGARGTTAAEIDGALHVDGWDALGAGLSSLQQRLATHDAAWKDYDGKDHALALRIANGAFAQDGWPIEDAYLRDINRALGAPLALVDYIDDAPGALKAINGWVARQTANRIPDLLGPDDVRDSTRLVLVNAIYLKAQWVVAFNGDTANRTFIRSDGSSIKVPTMQLLGEQEVPLATGDGWKATELRYLGVVDGEGTTPLAMTIVMPDDLAAFEKTLQPAKLAAIEAKLVKERAHLQQVDFRGYDGCGIYPYSVRLFLPRFGIDTRAELVPALRSLGLEAATDPLQANFDGITPDGQLFIAGVIHQANIDVDEKGTEAAAATAIVMDTGGCTGPGPATVRTLRLDHPFLFLVRDLDSGAILFMGRVMDPSVRS